MEIQTILFTVDSLTAIMNALQFTLQNMVKTTIVQMFMVKTALVSTNYGENRLSPNVLR